MYQSLKNVFIVFVLLFLTTSSAIAFQGEKSLQPSQRLIEENFLQDSGSLDDGYGQFQYSSDVGRTASVAGGKLFLHGDSLVDGDQFFSAMSQDFIEQDEWNRKFKIRVLLGGKDIGQSGAWHLGVFAGNIKMLFHPGVTGGAFRIETVDGHVPLLPNTSMPFTPREGVLYEMIATLVRLKSGCLIKVSIRDLETDNRFSQNLKVSQEDLGVLNRIGLTRSGRKGPDAMFSSISIKVDR